MPRTRRPIRAETTQAIIAAPMNARPSAVNDVEHVDVERIAVALRLSQAIGPRLHHLGPLGVILHARNGLQRFGRIADDPSIGGDHRHARAGERAETIGLAVELRQRRQWSAAPEEVRGQARLGHQGRFDFFVNLAAQQRREQCPGDGQCDHRRDQRGEKELGLEGSNHGMSASLYPNCLTVTSASVRSGSFSRSRRTWTSTVRVPPV
jgi:hypothetical protein